MAIGIPNVTQYGSSYGSFNGVRLKDYKAPEPKTANLNNADAKDLVEFKSFDQTIKDYVFARLGHPTVRVELTDFQIQICIEEATSKLEYHAPHWMKQYAVLDSSANINVYELPQEIANNLTDVYFRKGIFNLGATPGSLEYDFAIMFFTNTGLFNNYNVSQYMLMQMYLKQINKVLGKSTSWDLINNKYLQIFPVPDSSDEIILEFRGIDGATIHPAYKNWIQRYTLAVAKEILGRARSKYQTLPGPGGGTRLDGETLLAESKEEKQLLLEELKTEIENPPLFDIG
jgi:hypothetical protein